MLTAGFAMVAALVVFAGAMAWDDVHGRQRVVLVGLLALVLAVPVAARLGNTDTHRGDRDVDGARIIAVMEGVRFVVFEDGGQCVAARAAGLPQHMVCTPRDETKAVEYRAVEMAGRLAVFGLTDPRVGVVVVTLEDGRRASFIAKRLAGWTAGVFGGVVDGPVVAVGPEPS